MAETRTTQSRAEHYNALILLVNYHVIIREKYFVAQKTPLYFQVEVASEVDVLLCVGVASKLNDEVTETCWGVSA